ncbi:MAG: coenzyme F420-0:L-glutamate ligase [Patescibacteria group bacterium]|nr:coenzyme F420-0:L-glutamate ligase [Patescibacteria group bacterium]
MENKFEPNKGKNLEIEVGGETWLRLPVKTGIVTENDSIFNLIKKHLAPLLRPNDLIFISEKVVALTQGQIVKINDVKVGKLARFLARKINNRFGTKDFKGFGHSTPPAMQLFINEAGYPRVLFAAAVSAVTKPLGIKGLFYIISGTRAKSIDCPMSFVIQPYNHYAKLPIINPKKVAKEIKEKFGHDVVIIDANYIGAFSISKSSPKIKEKFIQSVFRDNPLGQSDEMTPLCIVRKK